MAAFKVVQKREKNGPVSLLVSARMNSEKATKNDGQHVSMRQGPERVLLSAECGYH